MTGLVGDRTLVLYNSNYLLFKATKQAKDLPLLSTKGIANASFIGQLVIGTKIYDFQAHYGQVRLGSNRASPRVSPSFQEHCSHNLWERQNTF